MTTKTPWHLHDHLKRDRDYRLRDGTAVHILAFDTMWVHTDRGKVYLPDLLQDLDPDQFKEVAA